MQFLAAGLPSYLHRKLSWLAHVGYQWLSEVEVASDLGAVLSWRLVVLGPGEILCHYEPTLCQFFSWMTDGSFDRSWGLLCFYHD